MVTPKNVASLLIFFLLIVLSFFIHSVYAIDNPDYPNFLGEFKDREQPYLKIIHETSDHHRDYIIAYGQYQSFLDKELNKAYQLTRDKLSGDRKLELKQSQLNWLKFRDTEFEFINNNWIRQNFGTSAVMSRGSYRCSVIRSRIIQLINYRIGM